MKIKILNKSKWRILEKRAPKLYADRIDYTLRDMYNYGFISKDEIEIFLNNLSIIEGK